MSANSSTSVVWFDHDGGVDDIVSLMTLLALQKRGLTRLAAVTYIEADSFAEHARDITHFVYQMTGTADTSIPSYFITGENIQANRFPSEWRNAPYLAWCKAFGRPEKPDEKWLSRHPFNKEFPTADLDEIFSTLEDGALTVISTGPPANVASFLSESKRPQVIGDIYYMGGSFDVDGNVEPHKRAEWNVYWHPQSTKSLFCLANSALGLKVKVCALDLTNSFPLNDFLQSIESMWDRVSGEKNGQQQHSLLQMVIYLYYYTREIEVDYYLWDVVTVLAVYSSEFFTFQEITTKVVVDSDSTDEGRTIHVHYSSSAASMFNDTEFCQIDIGLLRQTHSPREVFKALATMLDYPTAKSLSNQRSIALHSNQAATIHD